MIKKILADKHRDLCLFTLGINTNLRASDLLQITAGDVRHLLAGDTLQLKEKKTGKTRVITLNKSAISSIQQLLGRKPHLDTDFIFTGQRGLLTVSSVNRLVKSWCKTINLPGNYGSHTLRKTWGYHQRMAGTDIPTLMVAFNHSTQKQTLAYLGIQPEELKDAYLKVCL